MSSRRTIRVPLVGGSSADQCPSIKTHGSAKTPTRGTQTRCAPRRAGLTLLELLVTIVMIAAILPIAMKGVSIGIGLGSSAREQGQAAILAQGKLDELVATGQWNIGSPSGDFGPDFPGYTWTAQSQDWDGSTVRQLDVTVHYPWRSSPRTLTMSTLVTASGGGLTSP